MTARFRSSVTFANGAALLALVFSMAGGAYALSTANSAGVLHGCVSRRTGVLRVLSSSAATCHAVKRSHGRVVNPGEYPVSWNQQGPIGPQGATGQAGTVDTSQFYSKTAADSRFALAPSVSYASANNAVDGTVVASWPTLGFKITTASVSLGNIGFNVLDSGNQNINGVVMVHSGSPNNTITALNFGLNPGQTYGAGVYTTGPFIDFSVVDSAVNPAHAAYVHCLNVTSGGVTRAHCWTFRSDAG